MGGQASVACPPFLCLGFDDSGLEDNDGFDGNILVEAAIAGFDRLDRIHDVLSTGDLAEHGVPPPLGAAGGKIEEIIVLHVDEELRGCGIRSEVRAMAIV